MDSILLIDKPSGITSFDVIRCLRRTLGVQKMGHAGTLDPLATGLLIIGLEKATKELDKFMNLPKEYEVLIEFGKVSATYDADSEVREAGSLREISEAEFKKRLDFFIGDIEQTPPPFSAKRIKGVRSYKLAREGKEVKLEPRKVRIDSIEIIEWNWPFVKLCVKCGKGTYIRSLAHDLGQALGCGGYVKELRRTAIGQYKVEDAKRI